MDTVELYDTTLRDGAQTWGITFSLEDKLRIAQKIDELGIDLIEGGYPGSNPKDKTFFQKVKSVRFKHARPVAFGSTCRADMAPDKDPQIKSLIDAGTEVVTIVGKSWDLHVREILAIPLEKNLQMIRDSLAFLRPHYSKVIYDAEHFFDGFRNNPDYAVATLKVAVAAGADVLALCDTNGGTLPWEVVEIIRAGQAAGGNSAGYPRAQRHRNCRSK